METNRVVQVAGAEDAGRRAAALELSVMVGCPKKRNEDYQQDGAADHSRSDDYGGRQAH
jgi:hypothetical protein